MLAAELSIERRDLDDATVPIHKVFENAAATDRDRFRATLLLANVLRNKGAQNQTEVFDHLVKLARGSNDVSLDALVALGQTFLQSKNPWPSPGGMSVDDLIQGLDTHPLAKPEHKLLAVDLRIHQHPEERETILRSAIDRFKGGDNATLIALAGWLNAHGEYQRELDTISRQRAMQTRELFFQHVDALGALGRWDEIRKLIESEQFPLDPVVEHMYLARCFAQQNQTAGAENNWRRALEAAAGDLQKLITLGDYAEKNGALDVAAGAFQAAVAVSPKSRIAQQGRLRVAYAQRDTKKIHAILTELLKIWPNDTAVQNDEAYTRLLLLKREDGERRTEDGGKVENGGASSREPGEVAADGAKGEGQRAKVAAIDPNRQGGNNDQKAEDSGENAQPRKDSGPSDGRPSTLNAQRQMKSGEVAAIDPNRQGEAITGQRSEAGDQRTAR